MPEILSIFLLAAGCALVSFGAVVILLGILLKKLFILFPAKINNRSAHKSTVAQGGGLVIFLVFCAAILLFYLLGLQIFPVAIPSFADGLPLSVFISVLLGFMALGAWDDRYSLRWATRLIVQMVLVILSLYFLPKSIVLFSEYLPFWLERLLAALALLTIINITNFVDGIDGITVGWTVSTLLGGGFLLMIHATSVLSDGFAYLGIILTGALLGFLPYNRPQALVFLGDSGALPLGFFIGLLLYVTAVKVSLPAAMLIAAYPISDGVLTLVARAWRRQPLWQAHRDHLYQLAVHRFGFSHGRVSLVIAALQAVLSVGAVILSVLAAEMLWPAVLVTMLVFMIINAFLRSQLERA